MPAKEQGVTHDRYQMIPRTLIFLFHGEDVLLLKGDEKKRIWANRYNGIGGHVEQGEDVLSGAIRELEEETGIVQQDLILCGVITVDTKQSPGICIFVYKGYAATREYRKSSEGELEWVHIQDAFNLPLVEDLPTILPLVTSHDNGTPPFSAQYSYDYKDELIITIR
ncbi:MAG: NUDIX domain-containing protein [Anaerolineales bacterium]|nr:NUDIX domain-containing protein [Anaerolineales bacterium]